MNGRSKTSVPTISRDLFSAISLRELGSGALLCVWPDGRITERYGREVALASLSARRAKELGLLTSGTYGPRSSTLSKLVDLSPLLANRLRARTDCIGSILYRLTWKERATPSGRLIPALRASALRTSGKDFTGWVTPSARDWKDTGEIKPRADGTARNDQLPRQAFLCGWPTPCQQDGPNGGPGQGSDRLPGCVVLAGWPTPPEGTTAEGKTPDGRKVTVALPYVATLGGWPTPTANSTTGPGSEGRQGGLNIQTAVVLTGWPTPTTADQHRGDYSRDRGNPDLKRLSTKGIAKTVELRFIPSTIRQMPIGSCAVIPTARASGPLNPAHSLWLMLGPFATVWQQCAERVTRSTSRKRKASSKPQSKS